MTLQQLAGRMLILSIAGAAFGGGAYAAWEAAAHLRARATPPVAESADPESAPPAPRVRTQELVAQAIAAVPVRAPSELEAYLARLEDRARDRGAVTALDIEPGIAAATDQAGPERAQAFMARMRTLQQELRPLQAEPADLVPTPENMATALSEIAGASGDDRRARVRQYLRAADQLPEEEQAARVAELNASIAAAHPPAPAMDIDDLRARLDATAPGTERRALAREYLERVGDLPDVEAARRLDELNRTMARVEHPGT